MIHHMQQMYSCGTACIVFSVSVLKGRMNYLSNTEDLLIILFISISAGCMLIGSILFCYHFFSFHTTRDAQEARAQIEHYRANKTDPQYWVYRKVERNIQIYRN